MTEHAHTLVGFDPGGPDDDLVVVVLRQKPGEPWQLEHVNAPPQADTSWIARLTASYRPAYKPPPLAELVEQWTAADRPPDFRLSDEQRELLAATYIQDVAAGRLSSQLCSPWWRVPAPRTN
jgi:hypothetical protein